MKTRFVSFVSHSWVMFLDLRHFTSSPVSEKIKAKLHRKQEIDLHETMRNKRAFEVFKNLANRSMVPRLDPILFDTNHTYKTWSTNSWTDPHGRKQRSRPPKEPDFPDRASR